MIAKVNISLGKTTHQFEFEHQNEMEALHRAIAVSTYPTYCNVCKEEAEADTLQLTTNKDKEGNIYVNLKHDKCGARVKLGQYKQGGYFWHREFEVYTRNNQEEKPKKDIPF